MCFFSLLIKMKRDIIPQLADYKYSHPSYLDLYYAGVPPTRDEGDQKIWNKSSSKNSESILQRNLPVQESSLCRHIWQDPDVHHLWLRPVLQAWQDWRGEFYVGQSSYFLVGLTTINCVPDTLLGPSKWLKIDSVLAGVGHLLPLHLAKWNETIFYRYKNWK